LKLPAALHPQLGESPVEVVFDGADRENQTVGDLGVG
jgi:hypothetical protein